jgi:AraC family transcriptional regulator
MRAIGGAASDRVSDSERGHWSSGQRWQTWRAERRRVTAYRSPARRQDHTLIVHLSEPTLVTVEGLDRSGDCVLRAGDATFVPCGIAASLRNAPRDVLVLTFSPQLIGHAQEADRAVAPVSRLGARRRVRDQQIVTLCDVLQVEARDGLASGRAFGEALGAVFASRIVALFRVSSNHADMLDRKIPHSLLPVLQYIDDNLDDGLQIDQLARLAGLSHDWFAHHFRAAIGCAPHQYILQRRVAAAKTMLAQTDVSMTEVGYAVGFGTPSHFTQAFKRETGMTPSRFRASRR